MKKILCRSKMLLCVILCFAVVLAAAGCSPSTAGINELSNQFLLTRDIGSLSENTPVVGSVVNLTSQNKFKSSEIKLSAQLNSMILDMLNFTDAQKDFINNSVISFKTGFNGGETKIGAFLGLSLAENQYLSALLDVSKDNVLFRIPELLPETFLLKDTLNSGEVGAFFQMIKSSLEAMGSQKQKDALKGFPEFLSDLEKEFINNIPKDSVENTTRDLSAFSEGASDKTKELLITLNSDNFAAAFKAVVKTAKEHKFIENLKKTLDENSAELFEAISNLYPDLEEIESLSYDSQINETFSALEDSADVIADGLEYIKYSVFYESGFLSYTPIGREFIIKPANENESESGLFFLQSGDKNNGKFVLNLWESNAENKILEATCDFKNENSRTQGDLSVSFTGNTSFTVNFDLDNNNKTATGERHGTYKLESNIAIPAVSLEIAAGDDGFDLYKLGVAGICDINLSAKLSEEPYETGLTEDGAKELSINSLDTFLDQDDQAALLSNLQILLTGPLSPFADLFTGLLIGEAAF